MDDEGYVWKIILINDEIIDLVFTSKTENIDKTNEYVEIVKTLKNNSIFMRYIESIMDNHLLKNDNRDYPKNKYMDRDDKEKFFPVAIILHFVFPGWGYVYVNRFDKFFVTFILISVLVLSRYLYIPYHWYYFYFYQMNELIIFLISIVWVGTFLDSLITVKKYNE